MEGESIENDLIYESWKILIDEKILSGGLIIFNREWAEFIITNSTLDNLT